MVQRLKLHLSPRINELRFGILQRWCSISVYVIGGLVQGHTVHSLQEALAEAKCNDSCVSPCVHWLVGLLVWLLARLDMQLTSTGTLQAAKAHQLIDVSSVGS